MSNRREFRTETGKSTRKARAVTLERRTLRTLKYNPTGPDRTTLAPNNQDRER